MSIKTYMKFIMPMLVCPLLSMSQSKLEGIGRFKIGKTTLSVVDSIKTDMRILYGMQTSSYFFESIPDSTSSEPTVYCEGMRVFIATEGLVVSGVSLGFTRLIFYRDTLIELECNYSEQIEYLLSKKYGNPVIKDESKTIGCTYKLTGHSVSERDEKITRTWINGNIRATSKIYKHHNYKCIVEDDSFFKIELAPLSVQLGKCSQKESDRLRVRNLNKKLKDF